jgi:uroporphyrinogen decarboxylase
MNSRQKFLAAVNGTNQGRPPLWVMRQAGRYLPEYRELKAKHGFLEMVKTPELSSEVTLQPLQRFPLDAAILFCDILVIPEAMGQKYDFREGGGIEMEFALESDDCINKLEVNGICEKLNYVEQALNILRSKLGQQKALLGFAGSPWTLACYMIDGGSNAGFPKTIDWATNHPHKFNRLMEKITLAITKYIQMQIKCGIDAVQIFDSWQSLCPTQNAWEWSLKWIHEIINNLESTTPVILYAKCSSERIQLLRKTEASGLSVSHEVDLPSLRKSLPTNYLLQGNLAPELLETNSGKVREETIEFLKAMQNDPAHILNLGHGIRPTAKVECMEALVQTVTSYP